MLTYLILREKKITNIDTLLIKTDILPNICHLLLHFSMYKMKRMSNKVTTVKAVFLLKIIIKLF